MRAPATRTATCALDVEVRWGDGELLASEHLREPGSYELRTAALPARQRGFVVQHDWLQADALTLATLHDDAVIVSFVGGQQQTLRLSEKTVVPVGPLLFRLAVVSPHRAVRGGVVFSPRQHAWTVASFAVHALALFCMTLLPPKASSLSLDLMSEDTRTMRYLAAPMEREPEALPWTRDDSNDAAPGPDGARHAGEEGEAGKPDSARTDGRLAIRGHDTKRALANAVNASTARTAGILGVLQTASEALAPNSSLGAETPTGYDARSAIGALFGAEIGDNEGFHGLGMKHTGRGGGGDAVGTIGVGKLGTGDGARGAPGGHGVFGPRREARVPVLRSEGAEVRGSLSKETIRRTIQRRLNEVRFCYESALASNPELSGRLAIQFLIAPSGVVQQAGVHDSNLASQRVADCVTQAVRRLTFPAPDGGGYVQVTYPFTFSAE